MAATDVETQEIIEARMEIAETAMKRALGKGQPLEDPDCIKRMLQDHERILGSPGFFDVVPEMDLCKLALRLVGSRSRVPLSLRPPPSPSESSIEETISPQRETGIGQGEIVGTEENLRKPSYHPNEKQFTVKYQHPRTSLWVAGKAKCCEQEDSFISHAVVEANNLIPLMQRNRTIQLCWEKAYGDSEIPKAVKTRFKIVPDNQIDNDMAIGTAYMKLDEIDISISAGDSEENPRLSETGDERESRKVRWAVKMFYEFDEFDKKRPRDDDQLYNSMSKRAKGDSFG